MCINDALKMLHCGLRAVDPYYAVQQILHLNGSTLFIKPPGTTPYQIALNRYKRIFIIGAGKATSPMAKSAEEILGPFLYSGIIIVPYDHSVILRKVETFEASHPIPDRNSVNATRMVIKLLQTCNSRDLVICLLSGGGSSLLVSPISKLRLRQLINVSRKMLYNGAKIEEINTLRKHLSTVKGGQLMSYAYPASVISFIVSDVVGDPLDTISSGPTVPDETTFHDAASILKKYHIKNRTVKNIIKSGVMGRIPETPKFDDPIFKNAKNHIVCSNRTMLNAAKKAAENDGYNTVIFSDRIQGESKEIAKMFVEKAHRIRSHNSDSKRPACIISGGESTVTVKGRGLGGRNQEMALAFAVAMHESGLKDVTFLSCGSDGIDGPTSAAGAIVTDRTIHRAMQSKIDAQNYLNNNDSYHFFEKCGGHIKTGPTLTNVMDIQIMIVK